ncbi:MAG: TnpV protein [Lachnospiraceae bacterium]|nr:TnpV protein [Lachnospiraceae bacterium]
MILTGKRWKHLAEIDAICHERMDVLILAMAKQVCVTETLKATDQMEWVCRMNNIRNRAEEIVLQELVYA